jgi:NAD(P)-dependent dehydrogenase (short-subunit alcohol dehydrogenase family)
VKNIVITGSSRGIGYGLARAFLARGCGVMASGRSQGGVDQAVALLSAQYGLDKDAVAVGSGLSAPRPLSARGGI